ncbi:hypothetical protein DH2020_016056 [Rehmannia glutinosa]|uniref:Hflx-type G domain-containing protein n=1 Tax=Rehmannia glutinosa TaxID=99300 RepID=A0ABR0WXX8_REHGL
MLRSIAHKGSALSLKSLLTPINPSSSSSSSSSSTLISPQFPPLSSFFSNSPILERKQLDPNHDEFNKDPDAPPRLFVVQPRFRPETHLRTKLEEALNLANSLEQQRDGFYETEFLDKETPPHLVVQNPAARSPRAGAMLLNTYFRDGTVKTVKCHVNDLESKDGVDAIFVNAILTGIQQRNLEASFLYLMICTCLDSQSQVWAKPVLDRIGLIIELFNAHAQTKEAKLQAELAALMYKRSRLVRLQVRKGGVLHLVGVEEQKLLVPEDLMVFRRGSGGRGFISGAGETELQLQRRRILDRRKQLLSEIKEVRRTRAMQRAARKRQGVSPGQEIATVAVVGYTNAGKSTLVSALSNNYLCCDDRLFATVDTKLSSVILPSGRKVVLSDTVGFISDLPVQLVEAFHATLEEVVEADLLVHVLDASAPNLNEHRETVMQVLERIGVSKEKLQNMIEVWNKVDLLEKKSDIGEPDDGDYASSFSGEEDADNTSDELIDQHVNEQDIEAEPSDDLGDGICDEQDDYSDDWLSGDDEQDPWVGYDGRSVGRENVKDQQNEFSGDWKAAAKSSQSQSESTCHVKTSAVSGVGLQELLEIIDEKLGPGPVVERSVFDRKWRPPCSEDNEIAVEQ